MHMETEFYHIPNLSETPNELSGHHQDIRRRAGHFVASNYKASHARSHGHAGPESFTSGHSPDFLPVGYLYLLLVEVLTIHQCQVQSHKTTPLIWAQEVLFLPRDFWNPTPHQESRITKSFPSPTSDIHRPPLLCSQLFLPVSMDTCSSPYPLLVHLWRTKYPSLFGALCPWESGRLTHCLTVPVCETSTHHWNLYTLNLLFWENLIYNLICSSKEWCILNLEF